MRTIIGFVLAKTKYKVGLVNYKRDAYNLWQYRLWSFQGRDTKLERFLAKNQL